MAGYSAITQPRKLCLWINPTPGSWWASLIGQSPTGDSQCPGCLRHAVVTLRLSCAIVGSPRRHERVPFVNVASLRSRSTKRRHWKHKLDYYGEDCAHRDTGCGINAKDSSGLDSDRWIPRSMCFENPARGILAPPLRGGGGGGGGGVGGWGGGGGGGGGVGGGVGGGGGGGGDRFESSPSGSFAIKGDLCQQGPQNVIPGWIHSFDYK